jgi:hypothetical protein
VAGDADLIELVELYEQSFEEAQSPLVREMDARGGVEAAPRLARSEDPRARLSAARLMHLLPDEEHVAAQGGRLGKEAAAAKRRYRVIAFYGCSTNSYDSALRDTNGFGTREADILVTNRLTRAGAEISAFLAFLDGIVNQGSAERMLGGLNAAMRADEARFAGNPWQFTGLRDNPRR